MNRRSFATGGLAALGIFIVGSLGWDAAQMATAATPPRATTTAATQGQNVHLYLTIATPDMLGSDMGPAYLPSSFSVPAYSTVTITVTNFDDATALPAGSEKYASAMGVSGPLSIQKLDPTNPNAEAPATQATRLDPATGVSHTFTVAKLGLSVPIAPKSRTTFTFHTLGAGSFTWQCMDPCGSGPTGWDGAMVMKGFMTGTMTVCAC